MAPIVPAAASQTVAHVRSLPPTSRSSLSNNLQPRQPNKPVATAASSRVRGPSGLHGATALLTASTAVASPRTSLDEGDVLDGSTRGKLRIDLDLEDVADVCLSSTAALLCSSEPSDLRNVEEAVSVRTDEAAEPPQASVADATAAATSVAPAEPETAACTPAAVQWDQPPAAVAATASASEPVAPASAVAASAAPVSAPAAAAAPAVSQQMPQPVVLRRADVGAAPAQVQLDPSARQAAAITSLSASETSAPSPDLPHAHVCAVCAAKDAMAAQATTPMLIQTSTVVVAEEVDQTPAAAAIAPTAAPPPVSPTAAVPRTLSAAAAPFALPPSSASSASSASSTHDKHNSVCIKANETQVKDSAGAIYKVLQRGLASVFITALHADGGGHESLNRAVKAIAVARKYVKDHSPGEELSFLPFNRSNADGVANPVLFGFLAFKTVVSEVLKSHDRTDLNVSGASDANKMANAIISVVLDRGQAVMKAGGAAAMFVAMSAVVNARRRLKIKHGVDVMLIPAWITEETQWLGRESKFIRFNILKCSLHGPYDSSDVHPSLSSFEGAGMQAA